jgi:hypothetical protein
MSSARSLVVEGRMETFDSPSLKILPGYPLLIAPTFAMSSRPFLYISIVHWFLAMLTAWGIYVWARRTCPEAAVLITLMSVLNATFMYYYRRPLKEVAFLCALVWVVNVLHALIEERNRRRVVGLALAATLLLAAASLIRYTAMVIVPMFCMVLGYLVWQKRIAWKRAAGILLAVTAPATIVIAAYLYHEESMARIRNHATYVRTMQTVLATPTLVEGESSGVNRYWVGFKLKLTEIWRAVVPGAFKDRNDGGGGFTVVTGLRLGFAFLMGLGWWRLQRKRFDLLALMFPCYFLLYLPLACDQGSRPMMPYLPLLMACVWFAAEGRVWQRGMLALLVIAQAAVGLGYWATIDAPIAHQVNEKWDAMQQIADAIPSDRDRIGISRRDRARFLLEFALDRQVIPLTNLDAWQAEAEQCEWVVLPDGVTLAASNLVHRRGEGYVVVDTPSPFDSAMPALSSRPSPTNR